MAPVIILHLLSLAPDEKLAPFSLRLQRWKRSNRIANIWCYFFSDTARINLMFPSSQRWNGIANVRTSMTKCSAIQWCMDDTGWSFATAIFYIFLTGIKNNEIIQLNHFCQPHIETFWYFEVSLWSGEKKSCLSRLCQNNVMAPYCKGWEPKTHLCASNFQK